ncbi:hypothetical protein [Methermicoccus shengliensis]|nr:hypothetical protein [Methermicoccus shengliensis]
MLVSGYVGMGLKRLDEPSEIKEFIKKVRADLGRDNNIDSDALAVWTFNRLPKFFWDGWKEELKVMGVKWQLFLKIMRMHTDDFIKWVLYDKMSWDEVVDRVISTIEQYSDGE